MVANGSGRARYRVSSLARLSAGSHAGRTTCSRATMGPSTKPRLVSRLRDWRWGRRPEVEMEEPSWRTTIYPPGPGAKLSELAAYFRERWKEFLF
jgi:hypothetical protein